MTIRFSDLSKPMQRALVDVVTYGVVYREETGGWRVGRVIHRHGTMKALKARKLCDLTPIGDFGAAYPRGDGMEMLRVERERRVSRRAS